MFQASVRDRDILRLCHLSLTTLINPTQPTCISRFLDRPIPPHSTALLSVAFNVASPLSLTHSPHPLPDWYVFRLDFFPTRHPPPASLRRSSLHPAPRACFRRRVPRPFAPPCGPRPVPRSLSVPGESSAVILSVSVVSLTLSLPVLIVVSCHFLVLGLVLHR